jgi:hypothetical protein
MTEILFVVALILVCIILLIPVYMVACDTNMIQCAIQILI